MKKIMIVMLAVFTMVACDTFDKDEMLKKEEEPAILKVDGQPLEAVLTEIEEEELDEVISYELLNWEGFRLLEAIDLGELN